MKNSKGRTQRMSNDRNKALWFSLSSADCNPQPGTTARFSLRSRRRRILTTN
jgi:hypothetical protein